MRWAGGEGGGEQSSCYGGMATCSACCSVVRAASVAGDGQGTTGQREGVDLLVGESGITYTEA